MTQTIEFQDDWSRLKAAVESIGWVSTDGKLDDHPINTIHQLVPKLLDAYADLWQTSTEMVNAWEAYMKNQTPEGIYVPPRSPL